MLFGIIKRFRPINKIGRSQNTYHVCAKASSSSSFLEACVVGCQTASTDTQHSTSQNKAPRRERGGAKSPGLKIPFTAMAVLPREEESSDRRKRRIWQERH